MRAAPSFIAFLLMISVFPAIAGDTEENLVPDYYSKPGVNRFALYTDQNANEFVDPFSGQLALSYTDVYLPGNGLDIEIKRIYNNVQTDYERWAKRSPIGPGWSMTMGRVITTQRDKLCSDHSTESNTLDNPVIELPDGTRQSLYFANPNFS